MATAKTCFIDAFKAPGVVSGKISQLELPLKEFLEYMPMEFYFYYGSETKPSCEETVSWIVMAHPMEITPEQVEEMANLVDN
jgi:carbonic anhydrase